MSNNFRRAAVPGKNYRQIYGKSQAKCLRTILRFAVDIFFRKAVLRKLFDIGSSYKHCNFSHVCLLVKMASKTVTRSIVKFYSKNLTKFFTCYDCYPCEIPPLPLVLFPRKHGRTRLKALLNFRYVRVYMNGLHPLFSMAKVVVIIKKLSGNGQKPLVNVKQNAPTK